jgi:hypothetical protein
MTHSAEGFAAAFLEAKKGPHQGHRSQLHQDLSDHLYQYLGVDIENTKSFSGAQ